MHAVRCHLGQNGHERSPARRALLRAMVPGREDQDLDAPPCHREHPGPKPWQWRGTRVRHREHPARRGHGGHGKSNGTEVGTGNQKDKGIGKALTRQIRNPDKSVIFLDHEFSTSTRMQKPKVSVVARNGIPVVWTTEKGT